MWFDDYMDGWGPMTMGLKESVDLKFRGISAWRHTVYDRRLTHYSKPKAAVEHTKVCR